MINPAVKYPTQTTAPSTSYPYGGPQNVTTPGDNTGTPLDATGILGDTMGFFQKLIDVAGITPSGNPETVLASDLFDALNTIRWARTFPVGSLIEHYGDNPDTDLYAGSTDEVSVTSYPLIETVLPPALSFTFNATSSMTNTPNDGLYDGVYYVSVGDGGEIRTATDPTGTWTLQTTPTAENLDGVSYNGTYYVAVGANGTILTATDPNGTWTAQTSGTAQGLLTVSNDGTNFVAAGGNATILTATDPTGTWTTRTAAGSYTDNFNSSAYGNGYFVLGGRLGEIQTSVDIGANWVQNNSGSTSIKTGCGAFGDKYFVFGTEAGEVLIATDPTGIWTIDSTTYSGDDVDALKYGEGFYAFGVDNGDVGVTNSDVSAITAAADTIGAVPSSIIIGGGVCVVAATNGSIYTSSTISRQVPTFSTSQTGFTQYMCIA